MAKLTQRQRVFLSFLRERSGTTVTTEQARTASGLSDKSWRVYMNAGRYAPYIQELPSGDLLIIAHPGLTEESFYEQVKQTKGAPELSAARGNQAYRLESKPLGQGGFAVVYKGTHRETGAVHAVKVPKAGNDNFERLRREVCVMRDLDHDNIMPLLDYDEEFGWYAMPIAKYSLCDTSNLKPDELRQMVLNVAEGLKHGHAQGLTHRDVTPANILFFDGPPSRWVVADWGTVRRPPGTTTVHQTESGQLLGTEAFAAPELWQDAHGADARADIYSLGRVVAWALGHRKLIPNVPIAVEGDWAEFVAQTTRLDRETRPQNVDAMLLLIPN